MSQTKTKHYTVRLFVAPKTCANGLWHNFCILLVEQLETIFLFAFASLRGAIVYCRGRCCRFVCAPVLKSWQKIRAEWKRWVHMDVKKTSSCLCVKSQRCVSTFDDCVLISFGWFILTFSVLPCVILLFSLNKPTNSSRKPLANCVFFSLSPLARLI